MARRDEDAALKAAAALLSADDTVDEDGATAAEQETDEETVASQDADTETTADEEEDLFPSWEVDLPEDLEEELEAPTDEDILAELEQDEEYQELDETGRRLMARALAAERRVQFHENLRVKSEQKNWQEEAKKFFPLSEPFLADIKANSRRGFLREAKAKHEAVLPLVKPIVDKANAEVKKVRETAAADAKAKAKEAWGGAPPDDDVPTEASITVEQLARNRAKGDLAATIKAMVFPSKES